MKKYLPLLFSLATAILFTPHSVSAHVKWFVEENELHHAASLSLLETQTTGVVVWCSILVVAVLVACVLERILTTPQWIQQKTKQWGPHIIALFRRLVGLWLIYNSATGVILAVNMHGDSTAILILQILQFIAGVLVLGNRVMSVVGSIGILLLYIGTMVQFGFVELLDHVEVVGIALFIFFNTLPSIPKYNVHRSWALPLLRLFSGIALIVLAFTEKLLQPDMALSFLSTHPWNFMQMIGISWFSNELFILSAAFSEILFGVLFVAGLVTRLNTAALAIFFITTAIVLGPTEIIGHLPFFGMVMIYIFFGSGNHLKLCSQK